MALVSCKECETKVSSEAATCPHCGISNPAGSSAALSNQYTKPKELTSKEFKKLSAKDRKAYLKAGGKYEKTFGDKFNTIGGACVVIFVFILAMRSGGDREASTPQVKATKTAEQMALEKIADQVYGVCLLAVKRTQPKANIKYGAGTLMPVQNEKRQWETAIVWTALNAFGVTARNQTVCIFDKNGSKILSVETTNLGFEK